MVKDLIDATPNDDLKKILQFVESNVNSDFESTFSPDRNELSLKNKNTTSLTLTETAFTKKTSFDVLDSEFISDDDDEDLRDLFFGTDYLSTELLTAFNLLDESSELINLSLENLRGSDLIASDSAIMKFKQILPELFCLRSIGESFGTIVSIINTALSNRRGQPLEENQILALRSLINSLKSNPNMAYDDAVERIMEFERTGFDVDIDGLEFLTEIFDEQI